MTYRVFEDGRCELRHDEQINIRHEKGQIVVWICDRGEDRAFAFDTHDEARAFAGQHFWSSPSAVRIEDEIAAAAMLAEIKADSEYMKWSEAALCMYADRPTGIKSQ